MKVLQQPQSERLCGLLQFQLTVNFVALVIAFVSAITKGETPLTVIQLLWVNLIMDALGALGMPCSLPALLIVAIMVVCLLVHHVLLSFPGIVLQLLWVTLIKML